MLDKIKNFLNIPEIDEDEDDFYEEDYEDEEYTPRTSRRDTVKSSTSRQTQQKQSSSRGYSNINSSRNDTQKRERAGRSDRFNGGSKVVPMKNTRPSELSIYKPTSIEDSKEICNILIGGSPVVVNLEGFDSTEAQRIMDFICGCIHALDGTLSQISNYIFIFAPSGVDIHGDISIDTDSVPVFNKK